MWVFCPSLEESLPQPTKHCWIWLPTTKNVHCQRGYPVPQRMVALLCVAVLLWLPEAPDEDDPKDKWPLLRMSLLAWERFYCLSYGNVAHKSQEVPIIKWPLLTSAGGKLLLESWGTTSLPDWQPPFIFVWFTSRSHEHMHKKFKMNRTKFKGGCQSGRKLVTHNAKSDLPLVYVHCLLANGIIELLIQDTNLQPFTQCLF